MTKAPADIRSLARSYSPKALRVLVGIMCQPKAPASARVSAACAVLDRGYGRPEQQRDANTDVTNNELREMFRMISYRAAAKLPENAKAIEHDPTGDEA